MVKCARTACNAEIDTLLGGGVHKHTGQRYCLGCARRINRECGQEVVSIPKFNTRNPNLQQIPNTPDKCDGVYVDFQGLTRPCVAGGEGCGLPSCPGVHGPMGGW